MAEITVITPFRDAETYLPGVVANLRRQTFQGWHCLLVDHSSMDQGRAVAEDLIGADPRFRLISVPGRFGFDRQLPAIPRNRALSEVETSLVAFLDVDDLWHPLKLERQLSFHRAHRLELSVTSYCCFRDLRGPAGIWRCPPQALRPEDLRWRNDDNLSRRPRQLARWTYGVYRASGTPPLQALGLLLRWGGFHVSQRLRDRLRPCRPTGSVASLLEEPPPVWSRCGR
jgi:glycosyltransferase involved in cell wall biosynthesis